MGSKKNTGMLIDGVFASQAIDSSGEVLSIEGLDITTLEEGWGVANYEHLGEKDGCGREVVGKIVYARKIFDEKDCENERQLDYFKKIKEVPYLYGIVRLHDGAGHDGARALAAQIRDAVANDEKIVVRYSIEGATTKKDGNKISQAIAKKVAMTLKPCNKTAISGLIEDPNAPEGFSSDFAKSEETISSHGTTMVVGTVYLDQKIEASLGLLSSLAKLKALRKAMTAGSTDAAPSTLSGGAALQREDLDRRSIVNTAKATIRDYGWNKKFVREEFAKFAKMKLPEMSDDFIDHFTNVAEDFAVKRLKKSELRKDEAPTAKQAKPKLPKKAKPAAKQAKPKLPKKAKPAAEEAAQPLQYATIRGNKQKPGDPDMNPFFDPEKGVLHTSMASFPAYVPIHDGPESDAKYQEIMASPEIQKHMDTAMENWVKVHNLAKSGKIPYEVLMHAIMFSQLSPKKQVPVQELQYARTVDAMRQTGLSPDKPGFEAAFPLIHASIRGNQLPETSRETFEKEPQYYTKDGGLLSSAGLIEAPLNAMAKYHRYKDLANSLFDKHRTDSISAVSDMLNEKSKDQIPGIKIKTGLYAWGMVGGSNSVVPDTHFLRHIFGMHLRKDSDTIEWLKGHILNDSKKVNAMEKIFKPLNYWYLMNHPAVKHMLNHPKWGQHFEKPSDSIFPSFWLHWLTIAPHERHLGIPNLSQQTATSHAPFWNVIMPKVDAVEKAEEGHYDSSISLRTAQLHQQYVKDYGEVPAMFLYYHNIVPKLLRAAKQRQEVGDSMAFLEKSSKLEAGVIELRKALINDEWKIPEVHSVSIGVKGRNHPAGRFMVHNGHIHHLEDYHGILNSMLPEGPVDTVAISRLHGLRWPTSTLKIQQEQIKHPEQEHKPVIPPEAMFQVSTQPDIVVAPQRPSVFSYQRVGMDKSHCVEVSHKGATLDGRNISSHELQLLLNNAKNGVATITYHKGGKNNLKKADDEDIENVMSPDEVAKHIRAGVAAGHIHPDVEKAFIAHTYGDSMVPGVGNKYAYNQFRKNGDRPGVWLSMDANSFKHVNDIHGHDAGDHAIRAMGNALRRASASVGTGKVFRPGGDEFVAHFPTHEDAMMFMRHATNHLDSIPPINGQHKLSVSFGVGNNFPSADQALLHAKEQKKDSTGKSLYAPGATPHLAHSLLPGSEGPLTKQHPMKAPETAAPTAGAPTPSPLGSVRS